MTTLISEPTSSRSAANDIAIEWNESRWDLFLKSFRSFARMTATQAAIPVSGLLGPRFENTFGILMYHRVAPHYRGVRTPTWNVTPRRLRSQLVGLLKQGYQPWPLKKALAAHAAGQPIPPRVFVVTFDDGYANNYHNAWPILRDLNVPATVFLATAYLDRKEPFPFDDWTEAGSPSVPSEAWISLSTEQCMELHESGLIELGAHTHSHADYRNNPEFLESDIRQCAEVLYRRFGITGATFAFPYGTRKMGFSGPPLLEAARDAGVACALTTERRLVRPGEDRFDWGRFGVAQSDSAATIAVGLNGWYEFMVESKRAIKRLTTMRA